MNKLKAMECEEMRDANIHPRSDTVGIFEKWFLASFFVFNCSKLIF